MNRKGFTLIELLVTIALLAIISLISFVSINKVIEKNNINNCESLREEIKLATKEYLSDNRYNTNFNSLTSGITAQTLITNNYLKTTTIKNPFTKETINAGNVNISVSISSEGREVTTVTITNPAVLETCVYSAPTSSPSCSYQNTYMGCINGRQQYLIINEDCSNSIMYGAACCQYQETYQGCINGRQQYLIINEDCSNNIMYRDACCQYQEIYQGCNNGQNVYQIINENCSIYTITKGSC